MRAIRQVFMEIPRLSLVMLVALGIAIALPSMGASAQPSGSGWRELLVEHQALVRQGRLQEANRVGSQAFELLEASTDVDPSDEVAALRSVTIALRAQERYAEALPVQERLVSILNKSPTSGAVELADGLSDLAQINRMLLRPHKALDLESRALVILEQELGEVHPLIGKSLSHLSKINFALARKVEAHELIQRAVDVNEASLGKDHPDTLDSISDLAASMRFRGEYAKAVPLYLRLLRNVQTTNGANHLITLSIVDNLASCYFGEERYGDALPQYLRATDIVKALYGEGGREHHYYLERLAATYSKLAQPENELPLRRQLLDAYQLVAGPPSSEMAGAMFRLAETLMQLAQFEKALPLVVAAREIFEKVEGDRSPAYGSTTYGLATIYQKLGRFHDALPLNEKALVVKRYDESRKKEANSFHMEKLRTAPENSDEAAAQQRLELNLLESSIARAKLSTADGLGSLAATYSGLGLLDRALALGLDVLQIRTSELGTWHTSVSASLNNVGVAYGNLGMYREAIPYFDESLAVRLHVSGLFHPSTAQTLINLGRAHAQLGSSALAMLFMKAAVNSSQAQRDRVSRIGETELQSFTNSVSDTYQSLASMLIDQGRISEAQLVLDMLKEDEQFEFVRRSETADSRRTRIGYNSTEETWMARYREISDRIVALGAEDRALQAQSRFGLTAAQRLRQTVLASDLVVARKAFQVFLDELRVGFSTKGAAGATDLAESSQQALRELEGTLKGLGDDAVLLQYYVTEDKIGILLTTPGVTVARSSSIGAKDLNRQIREFSRRLRDPKADHLPVAQDLYRLLMAPVAHDLEQSGAKTVMLSLDGALRYLPFGALHDGQHYLVQRWNLPIYTSVAKNRLRDAVTPQWRAAGLGVTRALGEFAALPAVKAEMSSIVKTSAGGVLPGEVHLDEAFTALRLKDVTQRRFQLLHVASHFRFSPGTEVNSFLLLGDGQHLTLGDMRMQNFRFDNVDLLTLSACETGLGGGRNEKGQEIEGFGVIAQQQGAKAVLATLWPVADQSTAALMAEMYRRRQEQQLTKIEALRQAQLWLLAQTRYAHPFYWAPFILMGNWK
jgi:CHAT domain-containing protein